jgi:hypothetical protein
MDKLIAKIKSILTGGQSDFAMMLNHRWHGIDLYQPLVFAGGICFFAAAVCLALFILRWGTGRRAWLLLIGAVAFATAAYAASSTLGNLSAGSAISATDLFYDVQTVGTGGVKVTGTQLKTFLPGTINDITVGCQASGGGTGPTVNVSTLQTPTSFISGIPSISAGYCGGVEIFNAASDLTPSLGEAGATGFPVGWYTEFCTWNYRQTLTPTAGTIAGASTFLMSGANSETVPTCLKIVADAGNNWDVIDYSAFVNYNGLEFPTDFNKTISTYTGIFGLNTDGTARTIAPLYLEQNVNDINYDYVQPSTGFTIAFPNNTYDLILDPAGTLATGTVTMPTSPTDGQIAYIHSSQIISALTISSGNSGSVACPSTIGAGGSIRLFYKNSNTKWYC